jgi:hypothetical protein
MSATPVTPAVHAPRRAIAVNTTYDRVVYRSGPPCLRPDRNCRPATDTDPRIRVKRTAAKRSRPEHGRSWPSCSPCSLLTSAGNGSAAASSGVQQADHIQVELISEVRTVRAGEPFWVALRLVPDPGWHTYWRNPGDSGLETRIRWTLPEGVTAGEIVWPTPQHLPVAHIVNYGMEGETFLLTRDRDARELPCGHGRSWYRPTRPGWSARSTASRGSRSWRWSFPWVPRHLPAPEHEQAFAERPCAASRPRASRLGMPCSRSPRGPQAGAAHG